MRFSLLGAVAVGWIGSVGLGCSEHDPEVGHTGSGGLAGSGGVGTGGTAGSTGGTSGAAGQDAGADGGDPCAPPASLQNPVFPCEIDAILEAKCRRCHSDPPQNTAPFPLVEWQDTRQDYFGKFVYQRMQNAIETDFMPLTQLVLDPPVQPLTPAEKTTLLDWLADCAQPVDGVQCP